MKTLIRTITICIVINLAMAGFAQAQESSSTNQAEDIAAAELALKEAQKQEDKEQANVEVMLRQLKDLQKSENFDFTIPMPTPTPHIAMSSSGGFHHMGSDNSALIIPNTQINAEDIVGINQDLNVMSQIFNQKLNRENLSSRNRMFTGVWSYGGLLGGSSSTQTMYLQGYGAIFMMNVDFPLSPLPSAEEEQEKQEVKEDVDPVWEQTKKQIYEPQDVRRKSKQERPVIEYDPEKVEDLKDTLIESLKHAANIRALTSDESVILTVTGNSEYFNSSTTIVMTTKGNKTQTITTPGSAEVGQTATAKLVIRAKKSDIDAFANANINLEQFREKVQIISCPYVDSHKEKSLVLPAKRSSGYGGSY